MKNKELAYNDSIIDKTKKEIISEFGHGFNFYPDNTWNYEVGKTWWGMKTTLIIEFENNKATRFKIKSYYGKLNLNNDKNAKNRNNTRL
jgi:hypothetical protein